MDNNPETLSFLDFLGSSCPFIELIALALFKGSLVRVDMFISS